MACVTQDICQRAGSSWRKGCSMPRLQTLGPSIIAALNSASHEPRLPMYNLARQLLFKLSPETSHDLSLDLIGAGGRLGLNGLLSKAPAKLPVTVMGLEFPNPVGKLQAHDCHRQLRRCLAQQAIEPQT